MKKRLSPEQRRKRPFVKALFRKLAELEKQEEVGAFRRDTPNTAAQKKALRALRREVGLPAKRLTYWLQQYKKWGGKPRFIRSGRKPGKTYSSVVRDSVSRIQLIQRRFCETLPERYSTWDFLVTCHALGIPSKEKPVRKLYQARAILADQRVADILLRHIRYRERRNRPPSILDSIMTTHQGEYATESTTSSAAFQKPRSLRNGEGR